MLLTEPLPFAKSCAQRFTGVCMFSFTSEDGVKEDRLVKQLENQKTHSEAIQIHHFVGGGGELHKITGFDVFSNLSVP